MVGGAAQAYKNKLPQPLSKYLRRCWPAMLPPGSPEIRHTYSFEPSKHIDTPPQPECAAGA